MAEVRLRNLVKTFGGRPIIGGLSAHAANGSFTVVVGPSGCGKSTLLRLIAGLEQVDGGEIAIGGKDVTHVGPGARQVAMVFQNYALYPHMTVAQNLGFGMSVRGTNRSDIKRRVREAAETLQLVDFLDRKPRQLSGGQRQRVAMGRALVRDARVFLYDEPLSNLDAKLRVSMRTEIKRLHREVGATSLYVTHDQTEAMTLGDRLIVMRDGAIEQDGPPLAVYERPASVFVAGFIGSSPINLFPAIAEGNRVEVPGLASFPYPVALTHSRITLGIRPEHFAVCAAEDADFAVRAEIVEPQGAETIVHGMSGHTRVVVRLNGIARLAVGDTLPLRAERDAIHVFDTATGRRLGASAA